MKKFITIIAAALAMVAVSCNKENTINGGSTPGVLTATFEQTKVSYTENGDNLQPAWEVDDQIIGFDAAGATYTFTVTEVKSTTATLSADKTIADGAYHLIFKAGAHASDISDKSLAVSYDGQSGDKSMPAVMLADGTVTNGGCNFAFSNAGAIVGISAVKGVPASSAISKITVEGENLSGATVALDGSALKLTATAKTGDAVSTATLSGITADAQGKLSSIVYVAVPAGAKIAKVSATVGEDTYSYTLAAAKTCNANDYLYVKTQQFKKDVVTTGTAKATIGVSEVDVNWVQLWEGGPKFAEYNVGATSATETGTAMTFTDAIKAGAEYEWGSNWCTPSKEDLDELLKAATDAGSEKVTCVYTNVSGTWGFKFTGKEEGYTSNSVFFPAQDGDGSNGLANYWSGTDNGSNAYYMNLYYNIGNWFSDWSSGAQGSYYLVRPVLRN